MASLELYRGGLEELRQSARELLAPAPDLRVYEWMERHCEVKGENSGQYRSFRTPYVREPLDCFADRRIEDLALCWGTQTSKTTIIMGGVAYRLVNDPQDTLWVMPDKDIASRFSKNRWQPFVDACGPLRDMKPADRNLYANLEQYFSRATLYLVGSNSPSQVSSHPAGLIVMDEADKFGQRTDREAGALQNAEERSTTFNFPLHVKTSTPTVFHGEIWQQFLLGDQRYYWVPCPRCREQIKLLWAQVKWWKDDPSESRTDGDWDFGKVRKNTFYECQCCGEPIYNHEKPGMLLDGEWKPHDLKAPRERRSYHLNSLYSPWKRVSWPNLAVQWLQAKSSIDRRHKFINSKLAEIVDGDNAYDDEPISSTAYIPADIQRDRHPIFTIDVQDGASYFWGCIRMWAPSNGESWLAWEGKLHSKDEILEYQQKYAVQPNDVVLDMAHKTPLIAKWCVEHDWRGMWGDDKKAFPWKLANGSTAYRIISQGKLRDPHLGTPLQSESNKMARYLFWAREGVNDLLAILQDAEPHRFHIFPGVSVDYIRHMNSVKKIAVQNPRTGRFTSRWVQLKKHDHMRDCELMQIAQAIMRGFLKDDHYEIANAQQVLNLTEREGK